MELEQIGYFVSAVSDSNWIAVGGFALMFLVFLLRKILKPILRKQDADLLSAGLGVIGGIGISLLHADKSIGSVLECVFAGLVVGSTAVGFWELLGARLRDYADKTRGG